MRPRCALVALLLALSAPAIAKPSRPELAQAKAAFGVATTDYDAGRYDAALKGFERAHDLSRNPILFFNMAACAEKLGQLRVASAYLRTYLSEVPRAEDGDKVRERIGTLEERARQEDERRADEERRAEDESRRRKEDDERRAHEAPVVVVAPAVPVEPPPAHRYTGGFVALGVTAVLGIVAAGVGGDAVVRYHDLDHECGAVGCGNRVDGVHTQAIVADTFIGLTGVAAITTVVLFALESRHHRGDR